MAPATLSSSAPRRDDARASAFGIVLVLLVLGGFFWVYQRFEGAPRPVAGRPSASATPQGEGLASPTPTASQTVVLQPSPPPVAPPQASPSPLPTLPSVASPRPEELSPEASPSPTPSVAPAPAAELPEAAVHTTLLRYYRYIDEKNFASAYAMRSRACRARTSLNDFEKTYRNNHGVTLMRCRLAALSGDRARAQVIVAFTDTDGNVTAPVRYQGTVGLVFEDGEWRYDSYKLDRAP